MHASEGIFILYFAMTQNELFRALPDSLVHTCHMHPRSRLKEPQHFSKFLGDWNFSIASAASMHATIPIFLLSSHGSPYFRLSPQEQGHASLATELRSRRHIFFW